MVFEGYLGFLEKLHWRFLMPFNKVLQLLQIYKNHCFIDEKI